MVYLDYAAATEVEDRVLDLFCDTEKKYFANPNSNHKLGIEAKKMIDYYTKNIASLLSLSDDEIIYTSGASESNNLAVKGICERYKSRGKHILISAFEHNSILSSVEVMQKNGYDVDVIPVNKDGIIDIEVLKSMIRDDTILVSICAVDSEIGLIQPIEEIGKILKKMPNCHFHSDLSQAVGKINFNCENIDLITISPHKFFGLPGIGMLIKKKNIGLVTQINGGISTTIYRSGTPVLSLIASCFLAIKLALEKMDEKYSYVKNLSDKIKLRLSEYSKVFINSRSNSIPHIINFSFQGVNSLIVQKRLEKYDIYVSTKTSCCPINTPSKLVYALTKDKSLATSAIRLSISNKTTKAEIDYFLSAFDNIYKELVNEKI